MKASIEVESRREGEVLKAALEDPSTRSLAIVIGSLLPLTPRARKRILSCVQDRLDEDNEAAANDGGTNP